MRAWCEHRTYMRSKLVLGCAARYTIISVLIKITQFARAIALGACVCATKRDMAEAAINLWHLIYKLKQ